MQRGHAVVGTHVRVCAALLHQVLYHLQVALLARQVQGRGTVLGLGIHSPVKTRATWAPGGCCLQSLLYFLSQAGGQALREWSGGGPRHHLSPLPLDSGSTLSYIPSPFIY